MTAATLTLEQKTRKALSGEAGYVPLTPQDEAELVRRIRNGDREAVWALALANHNFVRSVAQRYLRSDTSLEDLVGEGLLGLAEAAERFESERGIKFITYGIWWVKRAILRYLRTFEHAVHVPKYKQYEMQEFWRTHARVTRDLGRTPDLAEMCAVTGQTAQQVQEIVALSAPPDTLDSDPEGPAARLPAPEPDAESAAILRDSRERLERALPRLDERARRVVTRRFGLDGAERTTLAALGQEIGLTKERVRQIEIEACARLRQDIERVDRPVASSQRRARHGRRLAA